jgi:hypothetical protein
MVLSPDLAVVAFSPSFYPIVATHLVDVDQ